MRNKTYHLFLGVLLLLVANAGCLAAADLYNTTSVPKIGQYSWANAINDAGVVVGGYKNSGNVCNNSFAFQFTLPNGVFNPYSGGGNLASLGELNGPAVFAGPGIYYGGPMFGCPGSAEYTIGQGHWPQAPLSGYNHSAITTVDPDSTNIAGYSDSGLVGANGPITQTTGWFGDGQPYNPGSLPGSVSSTASGVNSSDIIVGNSIDSTGASTAVEYYMGQATALPNYFPYTQSWAAGINQKGEVAITSGDGAGHYQAFIYGVAGESEYTSLKMPGMTSTVVSSINDNGQAVGYATDGVKSTVFLYSQGAMTDLNTAILNNNDPPANAISISPKGNILAQGANYQLLTPVQGKFVPINPCRAYYTSWYGESAQANTVRGLSIAPGSCNVPITATGYALNVSSYPVISGGALTLWPTGISQPTTAVPNGYGDKPASISAIISEGFEGVESAYNTTETDLAVDISGYFDPTPGNGLAFFPVSPCRFVDTRQPNGPHGGPSLTPGTTRNIALSGCGVPSTAGAVSLNITAFPKNAVAALAVWPNGQAKPGTSALMSSDAVAVSNSMLVELGTSGNISFNASSSKNVDLAVDVNGFFASNGTGGLTFHGVVPCRLADTRTSGGALSAGQTRAFPVTGSTCGIPSTARAYVLNIIAAPLGTAGTLTAWAAGSTMPATAATLNFAGWTEVGNAAIVAAGTEGFIDIHATESTGVIVDVTGYFAP